MTKEEVIDKLKDMMAEGVAVGGFCTGYRFFPLEAEQSEALGVAIAALQEPERKHGYWIYQGEADENYDINCTCSVCGAGDTHATDATVPYCWWCGAIMDGKEPIKNEQENQEKA